MGETSFHADLVHYLMEVLRWLMQGQLCALYENLNMYQTPDPKEYPVAPDVAVIKGIQQRSARSWRVGRSGPVPQVVFEIASEETWRKDLLDKPGKYANMGVQEYFAYDPNDIPLPASKGRRLFGWRLDQTSHAMKEIQPRSDGALWSHHLESWLVPDGTMLRLYDRAGRMRLTGMESEAQQRIAETRRADAATARAQLLAEKMRALGFDPDQLI